MQKGKKCDFFISALILHSNDMKAWKGFLFLDIFLHKSIGIQNVLYTIFFIPTQKFYRQLIQFTIKASSFFHFRSFSSSFAELIEFSSLSLRFPYRTAQSALFISFFTTVSSYRALIQGGKIHCGFPMFLIMYLNFLKNVEDLFTCSRSTRSTCASQIFLSIRSVSDFCSKFM